MWVGGRGKEGGGEAEGWQREGGCYKMWRVQCNGQFVEMLCTNCLGGLLANSKVFADGLIGAMSSLRSHEDIASAAKSCRSAAHPSLGNKHTC